MKYKMKFEYLIEELFIESPDTYHPGYYNPFTLQTKLDELGKKGWELVEIKKNMGIFKRQLIDLD